MRSRLLGLFLVACILLCFGSTAAAQVAASVEGVQMPAWVERNGVRAPLLPGMELKAGDQVYTGAGSRLVVRLAEGSLVKLGENGTLRFTEINRGQELFKAALGVLQGAFRFTTELVGTRRKREIDIRVSQVTAGIRGTDLWGRSRKDNEIVCLIEGEIEVGAEGEQAVKMDQPLQFYRRTEGKTQPVGFIDKKQLEDWAKETEIEAGRGAARRGGRWSVWLASAEDQSGALRVYDELRAAGYPAEILPKKDADKLVYQVRIRQLPSKAEAQALAGQLRGRYGITEPKVSM
jgi:hypothetical protein